MKFRGQVYVRTTHHWDRNNTYVVLSLDAETKVPLDEVFVGSWSECLREMNKRCEDWAECADEVTSSGMPQESYW